MNGQQPYAVGNSAEASVSPKKPVIALPSKVNFSGAERSISRPSASVGLRRGGHQAPPAVGACGCAAPAPLCRPYPI